MDRHTKVNPAVNQGKSRAVSDNTCVTNSDSHGQIWHVKWKNQEKMGILLQ